MRGLVGHDLDSFHPHDRAKRGTNTAHCTIKRAKSMVPLDPEKQCIT